MTEVQGRTKFQPHRFRVSVPAADEAVVAWMGLQDNPSVSIRLLIRESIERMGYVDVMNRPVDQLPRRGRPRTPEEEREDATADVLPSTSQVYQVPQPVVTESHQVPTGAGDLNLSEQPDTRPELLGIGLPTSAPDPDRNQHSLSPVPEPEQSSDGQVLEVNDIMAGLRQ